MINQNLSRYCTILRYSVEKIFATLSKRYGIFARTVPYHCINAFGLLLRFCCGLHCQLNIGRLKENKQRQILFQFIGIRVNNFISFHPIEQQYFADIRKAHKNKQMFVLFDPNNLQQFKNHLKSNFYLIEDDLFMFGGGKSNLCKGYDYLWASRDTIQMYIGIEHPFKMCLYFKYIRKKYKLCHDMATRRAEHFTDVVITHLPTTLPNRYDNNINHHQFSENLCKLISRCSNNDTNRSIHGCSHASCCLRYIQNIITGQPISNPSPINAKQMKNVTNISSWVGEMNKYTPLELIEKLNDYNIVENNVIRNPEEFIQEEDNLNNDDDNEWQNEMDENNEIDEDEKSEIEYESN